MPENYRIFKITEDPDETLRWILLEASRKNEASNVIPIGYKRRVDRDLFRFTSLFPGVKGKESSEPLFLFRLYAFITDDETLALLLCDKVNEIAQKVQSAFPLTINMGERALADDKAYLEREWELIGLALPGWIILFSDDVKTACQDLVEEGIQAAFLPARDEWLNRVGPEIEDRELHPFLLKFLLDSLPERPPGHLS